MFCWTRLSRELANLQISSSSENRTEFFFSHGLFHRFACVRTAAHQGGRGTAAMVGLDSPCVMTMLAVVLCSAAEAFLEGEGHSHVSGGRLPRTTQENADADDIIEASTENHSGDNKQARLWAPGDTAWAPERTKSVPSSRDVQRSHAGWQLPGMTGRAAAWLTTLWVSHHVTVARSTRRPTQLVS